ncbi:unnamed protein product, partial [Discosporangium mesarthrocarpum]
AVGAAVALVLARVRQVTLRILRGAGDPLSGALVFAGAPRASAALAFALDPMSLSSPVALEGGPTLEALSDGLDESLVTPSGLSRMVLRSIQALAATDRCISHLPRGG